MSQTIKLLIKYLNKFCQSFFGFPADSFRQKWQTSIVWTSTSWQTKELDSRQVKRKGEVVVSLKISSMV
jgi:hypothetical protein